MDQSQEELEDMMNEMDTDGDGDIGFEEFAVAIQHTYDDDMITQAAEVRLGLLLVDVHRFYPGKYIENKHRCV